MSLGNLFISLSLALTMEITTFDIAYAEHPSKALEQDFPQICQLSRDSIRANQQRINQLQSPNDPNSNYQSLMEEYNRNLARYTLFNGIRAIIENYGRLSSAITQATQDDSAMQFGVMLLESHFDFGPGNSVFTVNGITDVVMIEQSITSILGNSINMQQLSQFTGPVCPDQNISSTDLITCPTTTHKVSPLYLALRSQCTQTSNQSIPLCRTINLLNNPSNAVALEKTNELLESFRVNYQNAYLIESGNSSQLNDPLNDLKKMRDALMLLGSAEVYGNGNITYTDLSTEQAQLQQDLQGPMPQEGAQQWGMQLLVDEAQSLSSARERATTIYQEYSNCFNQMDARTAAEALCNGTPVNQCPHANSFTPERITWQRDRIQRCERCYHEDASACLSTEQITDLYPNGNIPAGGVKTVIEVEANQYMQQMRGAVDRSPLIRQMAARGLIDRTAGISSVERATELAMQKIGYNLTDLGNSQSLLTKVNSIAADEIRDANVLQGYVERNGTATEIPVSELLNGLYTGDNENARHFRADIQRNYQASLNEDIMLRGIASGQSVDNLNGRLESNSQGGDGTTVFHQMLSELLKLKSAPNGITDLACFNNNSTTINQEYLDQNRQNLEVIGNLMHKCVKEIGAFMGSFCDDLESEASQAQCRAAQHQQEDLQTNVREQERNLAVLGSKLRELEISRQFTELSSIQQQLFSLAEQTCQGTQAIQIVTCQNRTSVPYESSHGSLSFLVSNANEILGYVPNIRTQTRVPSQIILSLHRSCPRGERAATATNVLPICSYNSSRAETRMAETPATTGPLSADISDSRVVSNSDEEIDSVDSNGEPHRRPAGRRSNLRPVPRPTSPSSNSSTAAMAQGFNAVASSFGTGLGNYYGQISSPYGYNSGIYGLTSTYPFPTYPLGYSPYTGSFQSFSLTPTIFPSL